MWKDNANEEVEHVDVWDNKELQGDQDEVDAVDEWDKNDRKRCVTVVF